MIFQNREEAGKKLAYELKKYKNRRDVVVLGIPRGGVVVAKEVARTLRVPLDVTVARKIGAPSNPEFAIAAVGEGGEIYLNPDIAHLKEAYLPYIKKESQRQKEEIKRRLALFRGGKKKITLKNKIIILVDDGIATGSTMIATILSIKKEKPKKVIIAVPIAPRESLEEIKKETDEVICLKVPELFFAVGQFYQDFPQTEDKEVIAILKNIKRG